MAFWKFAWMLKHRSLYLRRVDLLEDKFEGRWPQQQIDSNCQWLVERGHEKTAENEARERKRDRRRTYINCWSIGNHDLDLMWKAYAPQPEAIAITSTVGRLQAACSVGLADDTEPLSLGQVDYVDLLGGQHIDYPNRLGVLFKKDQHFKLENELRIVHWPNLGDPDPPDHRSLRVDLSSLLVSVVLTPYVPPSVESGVRRTLDENELSTVPVVHSRQTRKAVD